MRNIIRNGETYTAAVSEIIIKDKINNNIKTVGLKMMSTVNFLLE